jgi:BirA family biotin operon repressor/biotin-[acetyl-CoA-carboxylase] ligase
MSIGDKIIYYANVSSTNDVASNLINSGNVVEGTVISAGFQSDGKGQRNNQWQSDPFMNLIMSVILKPEMMLPEQQFYISKIVSLSILDSLKTFSGGFSVKWPNDIYHGGDKIAGILIEHTVIGNKVATTIAGIGLNINQTVFPEDLPNPISLAQISGLEHNVQDLQKVICLNMQKLYSELIKGKLKKIDKLYEDKLYKKGLRSEFITKEGSINGTIKGVNKPGQLIISSDDGRELIFSFKEIEFR